MRPAQSLPRRSQLRPRWIAIAAATLLLTAQLLLLWRFAPFRPHTPPAWPATETAWGDLWQAPGRGAPRNGAASDSRKHVRAVVGVQTGFNAPHPEPRYDYALRRAKLRESWFPADPTQLARLEDEEGIMIRFVVGHSADARLEGAMNAEQEKHRDFLRLPTTESYAELNRKTLAFFSLAARLYDADFVVKVDDDAFVRLDRLSHALTQWRQLGAGYIGCMKTGDIFTKPEFRWYEPQHVLLGSKSYFAHAWGTAYVLSGRTATFLSQLRPGALRFFMNEDVTVGSWMLAFNVTHYDDRRLCEPACSPTSVVVYDMPKCAGLCDPIGSLPAFAKDAACTSGPAQAQLVRQIWSFD